MDAAEWIRMGMPTVRCMKLAKPGNGEEGSEWKTNLWMCANVEYGRFEGCLMRKFWMDLENRVIGSSRDQIRVVPDG